jgi:hypothetical protein
VLDQRGQQMHPQEQCQVSGSAPEAYERYMVPTLFSPWATGLVERMPLHPGEHVLDVACGPVLRRALSTGSAIFPDRLAALREMHRVLVPNGRLGLSVWRPIQQNPYMAAVANALERRVSVDVGAGVRTVCALGDAEVLRSVLLDAGFREVRICIAIQVMRFSSVEAFLPGQFAATPFAEAVAALASARTALLEDVRSAFTAVYRRHGDSGAQRSACCGCSHMRKDAKGGHATF